METPTTSGSYQPASNPMLPREDILPPATPSPKPASSMRIVWTVLVGAVILAGGVYAWMMLNPASPVAMESSTPTPTATATADPTAGWKTYTNTEFGFQLTFTDEWAGYYVRRHTPERSEYPAGAYFDAQFQKEKGNVQYNFYMKDSGKDYRIFSIIAYPKTFWLTVKDEPIFAASYLGEQAGFVFSKSGPQEAPLDQNLSPLVGKVTEILSTLMFTK